MTWPSVSAQIAANRNCFDALIAQKGWTIEVLGASAQNPLPLGHEIKAAME